MLPIRKYLLASVAGIAIAAVSGAEAVAGPIELNPQASNAGAAGGTQLSATDASFFADTSHIAFTSDVHINGTTGVQSAKETGSILITDFNLLQHGVTQRWDLYATFTIVNTGTWNASSTVFSTTSPTDISSVTVTLYGSPGGLAAAGSGTPSTLAFTTPTAGSFGVASMGAFDFVIGTAGLSPNNSGANATAVGCESALLGPATCTGSSTVFSHFLDFTPATGTTGLTGFFENLTAGFVLQLGTAVVGTGLDSSETVNADGTVDFVQRVTASGNPTGGGQINYDVALIPEPTSLALLGAALIGFGGLGWRRRRNQQGVGVEA